MKIFEAVKILRDHNAWRRHDGDQPLELPHAPARIGDAIDLLCDAFDDEPASHEYAFRARLERGMDTANPLRELSAWQESDGDVLWWALPIEEPPYVGSPLVSDWPGYHTHWTRFYVPESQP